MIEVIYVMWLRQLKKYWRSKARMIGSLGQPLLFLVALGFGMGSMYQKAGGGSFIQFLAPGTIAMAILFSATFTGIEIIWDRQFGFLKETLVAPVSRTIIMLGRALGGATVSLAQGTLVLIISLFIGLKIAHLSSIPIVLLFMFMIAYLFTTLGTALAANMQDMQAFPLIINFIMMPLFFLSGALFPLDTAPVVLQWIAKFNPLSYGIDGMRGALTGIYHFGMFTDFIVMLLLIIGAFGICQYLFSRIQV